MTQLWGQEDDDDEAVGAMGGWDNSVREILYQGNADELYQDQEDDEPWADGGGLRNWDMNYVRDPEEEEEARNYYLGGLRRVLRIDFYSEETLEEYHWDEAELCPDIHLPPPQTPPGPFTCSQCRKALHSAAFVTTCSWPTWSRRFTRCAPLLTEEE